jgi:hypothetical protein
VPELRGQPETLGMLEEFLVKRLGAREVA